MEHTVKERKKQLKKEGRPTNVEEDDPELFKQAVYKQTMKLFAELEIKRKEREAKEMHERYVLVYLFNVNVKSLAQLCLTLCDPVDCSHEAPPSMGFSRQEYWSGLQFPSPGDLPQLGIELVSLKSPALADGFFTTSATLVREIH